MKVREWGKGSWERASGCMMGKDRIVDVGKLLALGGRIEDPFFKFAF